MKLPFLIGLSGVVGALIAAQAGSSNSLLDKNTKALQAATALSAEYTVQNVPGGPVEYSLKFAKPAKFRLESPDDILIGDGSTLTHFKKKDKTYTQVPQKDGDLKKLLQQDAVLSWAAFFTKEPFKDATGIATGSKHMIKGKAVTDVSLTLAGVPERTATLFIDQGLGVARGISIKLDADKSTIVMAKDLVVSADAAKDSDFAFEAPDGAKKIEVKAISFDKVAAIFQQNCVSCHSATRPKAALNLTTYAGAMTGGRNGQDIVPGDPDNSPIIAYLKASGKPQMPPSGGPLSDSDIQTIWDWIFAGATEK